MIYRKDKYLLLIKNLSLNESCKIKVRSAPHHRRLSMYSVRTPEPARRLNFQMDITSREVKFEARRQGREPYLLCQSAGIQGLAAACSMPPLDDVKYVTFLIARKIKHT